MSNTTGPMLEGYITRTDYARMLGISPRTEANQRVARKGPPFYPIGKNIFYKLDEVKAWVDAQKVDVKRSSKAVPII